MKTFLIGIFFATSVTLIVGPPVNKFDKKDEEIKTDPFEFLNHLEYKNYIQEVLTELEKDKDFQKRISNLTDHGNATSVADQLRFASHSVRSRLDEIKRREISRLNELEKKYANLKEKKTTHHVDHFNPHTFEIEDLQKLIKKVTSDLVEIDQKQENEYKEYEMGKELKRRKKLTSIKDKNLRKEEELKFEESKKRHRKHEKLHHPGSEEHLKDVWEKEDHMDKESFNYKSFFNLHDKDGNNLLDEAEIEALMMSELDKVYEGNNPDDDVMERYHEMMKMRQEMMKEADTNEDKVISLDEFLSWTKKSDFKKDPEWKTTEEMEEPVYTKDELREFNKKNKIHPDEYLEDFDSFEDGNSNQGKAMQMDQHVDPNQPDTKDPQKSHEPTGAKAT